MFQPRACLKSIGFASLVWLAMPGSTASAGSIATYTPSSLGPGGSTAPYTVTDLGVMTNTPFDGAAPYNQTITTPGGKLVYPFPTTVNLVNLTGYDLSKLPQPDPPSAGIQLWMTNAGLVVALQQSQVEGQGPGEGSELFASQRLPDGTFGPKQVIWTSANNSFSQGIVPTPLDIDNNWIVGNGGSNEGRSGLKDSMFYYIYNAATQQLTELPATIGPWTLGTPELVDDQGRIVFLNNFLTADPGGPIHDLLLTPDGVLSNPMPAPTPTPEPSTFVTLAVAGAGLAIRRRWKS